MLISCKGTVRHPKFDASLEALAKQHPRLPDAVDGAVWVIQRDPTTNGIYLNELGIWQAKLILPPPFLLLYVIAGRIVHMLTILAGDEVPLN